MTAREIQNDVAASHDLTASALLQRSNVRRIVAARNEFMARLQSDLGWSYPQIGKLVDKHHTTVLHGIRRHLRTQPLVRPATHSTRVEILEDTARRQARIISQQAGQIVYLAAELSKRQVVSQ